MTVKPIDGWGFDETVDGELAPEFTIEIAEAGVQLVGGILGWRGSALDGKYAGTTIEMSPRHEDWDDVVVLRALRSENRDDYFFYGLANTAGLKRDWT
ncbi:hypothetical protein [Qipengyuania sp. SM2507]